MWLNKREWDAAWRSDKNCCNIWDGLGVEKDCGSHTWMRFCGNDRLEGCDAYFIAITPNFLKEWVDKIRSLRMLLKCPHWSSIHNWHQSSGFSADYQLYCFWTLIENPLQLFIPLLRGAESSHILLQNYLAGICIGSFLCCINSYINMYQNMFFFIYLLTCVYIQLGDWCRDICLQDFLFDK